MNYGFLSLGLLTYTALHLYRRSRATLCATSAAALAVLISLSLLTWSVALTSVLTSSHFSSKQIFFTHLLITIAGVFWLRSPFAPQSGSQRTSLLSAENLGLGCLAAIVMYFATYPHFLPAWGNVDFAQHVAMIDSLKLSLLDLGPHSIPFSDSQKSYPYQFSFHFFNAYVLSLIPAEALSVIHMSLAIICGVLILSVLELSEIKNTVLKLAIVATSFYLSPIHAFIRLGWAPHFLATALSLLAFVLFKSSSTVKDHDHKLHFSLMISMLWLCSAAYPFCGIAAGMGVCWYQLKETPWSFAKTASLAGICLVVLLPLMLQPILLDTLTVSFKKMFQSGQGEYYHALRVGSSEPLVSSAQWTLFALIAIYSISTYKTARSISFLVYLALLIAFSLLLGNGAYIVDKVLHTTWPIVIAILAHLAERSSHLLESKMKPKYVAYLVPATFFCGLIFLLFKPESRSFSEKREPFLTKEELAAVRFIQNSKKEHKLLILGLSGSKEFLVRHMLQDGVWTGPFYRENYHISGSCEQKCALSELEKFKAYQGFKLLLATTSSIDIDATKTSQNLKNLKTFSNFVLLEPEG